jgi:hypothetical protein
MAVRSNYLSAALNVHRRSGQLENRDQRWYLPSQIAVITRGTEGSNPSPSSGESPANLTSSLAPVTDPEAPPIRPERHIPNSIATIRRRLIVVLARSLPRCPCCNAPTRNTIRFPITDAVRLSGLCG